MQFAIPWMAILNAVPMIYEGALKYRVECRGSWLVQNLRPGLVAGIAVWKSCYSSMEDVALRRRYRLFTYKIDSNSKFKMLARELVFVGVMIAL